MDRFGTWAMARYLERSERFAGCGLDADEVLGVAGTWISVVIGARRVDH